MATCGNPDGKNMGEKGRESRRRRARGEPRAAGARMLRTGYALSGSISGSLG